MILSPASYKFFITDAGALELNAGFGLKSILLLMVTYNGYAKPFTFAISASYQHHFEIPVRGGGLYWFIGGGLTAYRAFSSYGDYDGFGFGLFPTGGVDFKIPRIPLAVSADYRPTFFVTKPVIIMMVFMELMLVYLPVIQSAKNNLTIFNFL